jgi:DNA-binding NarL/FixJ family response regulator
MSAVDFIQALHPDMVLFDIGRQEANGSTSVKKFHAKFPQLPIIILSLNDDA